MQEIITNKAQAEEHTKQHYEKVASDQIYIIGYLNTLVGEVEANNRKESIRKNDAPYSTTNTLQQREAKKTTPPSLAPQ
jgi:hypothetical protein